MRKVALLGAILLGLAGTAQAHGFPAGSALLHSKALGRAADVAQPSCPAGVPVQTITVVNQANVRPAALAKVERAMVDQSLQLRAAWGTPCVRFAPGGWNVDLRVSSVDAHYIDSGTPDAFVATGGTTFQAWSSSFSHELIEMLVDPTTTRSYTHNPESGNLEVADPVEDSAYRLDGTWVSDFVLPAWYAGGTDGACETVGSVANGQWTESIQCDGSSIAPAGDTGPYDEMDTLSGPWQAA